MFKEFYFQRDVRGRETKGTACQIKGRGKLYSDRGDALTPYHPRLFAQFSVFPSRFFTRFAALRLPTTVLFPARDFPPVFLDRSTIFQKKSSVFA